MLLLVWLLLLFPFNPTGFRIVKNRAQRIDSKRKRFSCVWVGVVYNEPMKTKRKTKAMKTPEEKQVAREKCQRAGALFTDAQVRQIRAICDEGKLSYMRIAQVYGCGLQTIKKMHKKETYHWVTEV